MTTAYRPLPTTRLAKSASYHRPRYALPTLINLDSPASQAMTDLKRVYAVTIGPNATIDDANQKMKANSVRLLLVTNLSNSVVGMVTSTDILGEKPVLYMQKTGLPRADVQVYDVMTHRDRLQVMQWVDVAKARVGDIVENLLRDGRQHALVADIDEATMQETVRGIFSLTSIARQVGTTLDNSNVATTFAELEQALIG